MQLAERLTNGLSILRARWYLRPATRLGRRVRLTGRPSVINHGGQLLIGDRVVLISTIAMLEIFVDGGVLEIGARTFINYGCSIAATQLVRIGQDCKLGKHSIIIDNNFHDVDPARRNIRPASASVVIEDNVWLGSRVIVLPGVTIGAGSAIGAGSVVTKDVPPRSLAVGSPAKVVRAL